MRTAGIICECNPMHAGHRYLIEQARLAGADAVICVMSGCFTQRGEAAILDPQTRARILLDGGADAVFELPFPYSSAGAEHFAAAGVSILSRLGVDELWFGSECGSLALLEKAARIASEEKFLALYRERFSVGNIGTAKAYFDCLAELGVEEALSPNDILGISYLRAIHAQHSRMTARTVKRVGSGFHDDVLSEDAFPSASALRELLRREGWEAWSPYLSGVARELVSSSFEHGLAPADAEHAARAILAFFRMISGDATEKVPELSGGLGRRIAEASLYATSLEGLIEKSATKKYPASRIRRGILFAMTGAAEEDLRQEPAYAVLLAANRQGCAFLSRCRRASQIPIVTSHAGIPQGENAKRQEELTRRAFALYTLCLPKPVSADTFLRASSWIQAKVQDENSRV